MYIYIYIYIYIHTHIYIYVYIYYIIHIIGIYIYIHIYIFYIILLCISNYPSSTLFTIRYKRSIHVINISIHYGNPSENKRQIATNITS